MKKIQLLSILVLSGAVLFGGKATAHKAKVNFKKSDLNHTEYVGSVADLMIDSDKAIHGLQFDIKYNPAEIKSITPAQISGFEVKYNELSDGLIRGLVFSMQGQALPKNLEFEFLNVDGFDGVWWLLIVYGVIVFLCGFWCLLMVVDVWVLSTFNIISAFQTGSFTASKPKE